MEGRMKYLRVFAVSVAVMSIFTIGCSSPGRIAKGVYDRVLEMYDNNELHNTLTQKYYWDESENFSETNMFFVDPRTNRQHQYYLFIIKNTGSQKDAIEEAKRKEKYYTEYNRENETHRKDTIVISIPKRTTKNLDVKVYDAFMSVVQ